MEFFHRAPGAPARLGILPGTFNPVTTAHMALAEAGLGRVDEVLFVLPRELPHKEFTGASFAQRMEMLRLALKGKPAFSLASSEGGLFLEIAAECRREYGAGVSLWFQAGAFAGMLRGFGLLVAGRRGSYAPPAGFGEAIRRLELAGEYDAVSATAVRQGIARGERGELMVPAAAREMALGIYRSRAGWVDPGTLRLGPD
jgi:cytidyltransferase-like protein